MCHAWRKPNAILFQVRAVGQESTEMNSGSLELNRNCGELPPGPITHSPVARGRQDQVGGGELVSHKLLHKEVHSEEAWVCLWVLSSTAVNSRSQ